MPFRSDDGGLGISGAGSSGISLSRFWTPTMSVEMVEDADDEESFTPPGEKERERREEDIKYQMKCNTRIERHQNAMK